MVEKVKSLIEYSLHDEYVSLFRQIMTIEQFRSPELSALYSQRYVNQIHDYHKGLFTKMIASGILADEPDAKDAVLNRKTIHVECLFFVVIYANNCRRNKD